MTRQDEVSRQRLNTAKPKSDKKGKRETQKILASWYHEKQRKPSYKTCAVMCERMVGFVWGGNSSVQLWVYIHVKWNQRGEKKQKNNRENNFHIKKNQSFQSFKDL